MKMKHRFLVPLDGSERALETCRHIASFRPFQAFNAVLFHVFSGVPDACFDAGRRPSGVSRAIRAWQTEERREIEDHFNLARRTLTARRFPAERIEIQLHRRRYGVARDIIREARGNYEFVVASRRGINPLSGMIIGSVTLKLLQGLSFTPLLIAGRKPPGNQVLIGFDGSPGAQRAVRFLGGLIAPYPELSICLLHVFRGGSDAPPGIRRFLPPLENAATVQENIMRKFDLAKSRLAALGIAPERIRTRFVSGAVSRAAEIVKHARTEEIGVIALGRRGVSRVRDFFIGRVTNKVLHLAHDRSVWIVH
jgi:nucleotide-binding universal stress UspA family protein